MHVCMRVYFCFPCTLSITSPLFLHSPHLLHSSLRPSILNKGLYEKPGHASDAVDGVHQGLRRRAFDGMLRAPDHQLLGHPADGGTTTGVHSRAHQDPQLQSRGVRRLGVFQGKEAGQGHHERTRYTRSGLELEPIGPRVAGMSSRDVLRVLSMYVEM